MKTSPDTAAIRLRLRDLAQLFNSLDPSPFIDRDLDADAEEFITSWARELPAGRELELHIELAGRSTAEQSTGVEAAIRRYFATRADMKQLESRQLMRRGRLSLAVGSLFLALCLLLAGFVAKAELGDAGMILAEGLTICGWVAMWRPLEIYLFDWWPLAEERRRLNRLARIRVCIGMQQARAPFPNQVERNPDEITQTAA